MKMPLCPAVLLCSKKPRKLTLLLAHFHSSLGPESPGPYGLLQALNFLRRERGGRGSPTHWRNCLRPLCWGLLCSVIQKIQTALFQNSEFLFPLLPPQLILVSPLLLEPPVFLKKTRMILFYTGVMAII